MSTASVTATLPASGKMRKTGRAANLISAGKRDKRPQHPCGQTEHL